MDIDQEIITRNKRNQQRIELFEQIQEMDSDSLKKQVLSALLKASDDFISNISEHTQREKVCTPDLKQDLAMFKTKAVLEEVFVDPAWSHCIDTISSFLHAKPWLIRLCRPIRLGTARDMHHLHIRYLAVQDHEGVEFTLKQFDASPLVKRGSGNRGYSGALIDNDQYTHSDYGRHVINYHGDEDHWMAFELPILNINEVSTIKIKNRPGGCCARLRGAEVTIEDPKGIIQWKKVVGSVSEEYIWKITDGERLESGGKADSGRFIESKMESNKNCVIS